MLYLVAVSLDVVYGAEVVQQAVYERHRVPVDASSDVEVTERTQVSTHKSPRLPPETEYTHQE